jgi:hypothetical protein
MLRDLAAACHKPWWKGARGEWLVVLQVVLLVLVFLGSRGSKIRFVKEGTQRGGRSSWRQYSALAPECR